MSRAVKFALRYNGEKRFERRILIRLIVKKMNPDDQLLFEALVCAMGWRIWAE